MERLAFIFWGSRGAVYHTFSRADSLRHMTCMKKVVARIPPGSGAYGRSEPVPGSPLSCQRLEGLFSADWLSGEAPMRAGPIKVEGDAARVTAVTEAQGGKSYHMLMAPIPDKIGSSQTTSSSQIRGSWRQPANRATSSHNQPTDTFSPGFSSGIDGGFLKLRLLAREGGYTATFGQRGNGSGSVPVYQDEASRTLPKGWHRGTESNGVNSYWNDDPSDLMPKVIIRKKKRTRKSVTPEVPKPKSERPKPKRVPWQGPPVLKPEPRSTPVKEIPEPSTVENEVYIHPYVRENAELIRTVAKRHRIPPEVLGATIATELRGGKIARFYQREKNGPAAIYNLLKGEGVGSTSLGPAQVSVNASLDAGAKGTPGQEFMKLHLSETYAVDRAGAYLKHLYERNYQARSNNKELVQPLHYSDRDWARVISGYNTGDVTSNRGTYGPLYKMGEYSMDIQKRLKACRELLKE